MIKMIIKYKTGNKKYSDIQNLTSFCLTWIIKWIMKHILHRISDYDPHTTTTN